jgi:hypothetical protein
MNFIRSLGSTWRRTDLQLVSEPRDGERRLVDEGVVDALVAEDMTVGRLASVTPACSATRNTFR